MANKHLKSRVHQLESANPKPNTFVVLEGVMSMGVGELRRLRYGLVGTSIRTICSNPGWQYLVKRVHVLCTPQYHHFLTFTLSIPSFLNISFLDREGGRET